MIGRFQYPPPERMRQQLNKTPESGLVAGAETGLSQQSWESKGTLASERGKPAGSRLLLAQRVWVLIYLRTLVKKPETTSRCTQADLPAGYIMSGTLLSVHPNGCVVEPDDVE